MKQVRKHRRFVLFFLLLFALVGLTAWQGYASSNAPYPTGELLRFEVEESLAAPAGARAADNAFQQVQPLYRPDAPTASAAPVLDQPGDVQETCTQMLVNPELDVLDFGDGTGTAEPWVILDQIVYFSDQEYVSPIHSLLLVDDGDTAPPDYDVFGQAFNMPTGLVRVRIEYATATLNTNSGDNVYGELYTVDANGYLDQFLGGWTVGPSDGTWALRYVEITNPADLAPMQGQRMAILLLNETDGVAPGEVVYFDDIQLLACRPTAPTGIYLPTISKALPPGPSCVPPTESPPDSWYNSRGDVDTGAVCNSTLSSLDDRDYYSYTPTQSGNHTLHLRNLPPGSNWAALMYDDTEPPPSGPTNGGSCYTSDPGSGDKSVVCNLQAGKDYVVKVSVGGTPMQGSYQMQVTIP